MSDNWHEQVRNKNRDEIITAGKELFFKHNFLNVNIKDVCERAGISRVTFYKYFQSIEELIFEIHIDILSNMTQYINSADRPDISGIERLRLMLSTWVDFAKNNMDQMKFISMFDLCYDENNSSDVLKQRREEFLSDAMKNHFLNSAINAGIKDKSLKQELDVIKTGSYIFTTIMGVLQRMSSTSMIYVDDDIVFEEITQSVVESIISYIKNDKSDLF